MNVPRIEAESRSRWSANGLSLNRGEQKEIDFRHAGYTSSRLVIVVCSIIEDRRRMRKFVIFSLILVGVCFATVKSGI